ncbi:MAG: type II toxin-antitoxin system VapC family toxin [Candidatus Brennerbacteria bacterium]|nr:type II toxin-antitoxin system VapC family toxin [Candidatus Brennerbacteria bacterium]
MEIRKFQNLLSKSKRIGLDSMAYIYLLEEHPKLSILAENIFERAENNKLTIISSVLILIEVLTGFRKSKEQDLEKKFQQIINEFSSLEIYNVDQNLVNLIVDLRANYNLKTPDAIHLATAIEHGADIFITNDRQLKKVKEINILYIGDYI